MACMTESGRVIDVSLPPNGVRELIDGVWVKPTSPVSAEELWEARPLPDEELAQIIKLSKEKLRKQDPNGANEPERQTPTQDDEQTEQDFDTGIRTATLTESGRILHTSSDPKIRIRELVDGSWVKPLKPVSVEELYNGEVLSEDELARIVESGTNNTEQTAENSVSISLSTRERQLANELRASMQLARANGTLLSQRIEKRQQEIRAMCRKENDKHWSEVLNLARNYGFVAEETDGTVILKTNARQSIEKQKKDATGQD